jgi:hypothetical protein
MFKLFTKKSKVEDNQKFLKDITEVLIRGISDVMTKFAVALEKDINLNTNLRINDLKLQVEEHQRLMMNILKVPVVTDKLVDKATISGHIDFVNNLSYARDKFASTSHEKGVITGIINKIKKQHANSFGEKN